MAEPPPSHLISDPRQKLLLAAEEVFAAKGYEGASVREICSLAGMNVAAVNYHFGDKQRLYIEAVKHAHQCTMDDTNWQHFPPDTSRGAKLKTYIQMTIRAMHGPVRPTALQLMMREMSNPTEAAQAVVSEFIQPMAFGLRAIITELFPHLTEKQRLMIGFSIVGQCLYYRQNRAVSVLIFGPEAVHSLDLESVSEHIVRFSLAALGLGEPYRDPKENA